MANTKGPANIIRDRMNHGANYKYKNNYNRSLQSGDSPSGLMHMDEIYSVGLNGSTYESFMAAIAAMDVIIDVRANPNGSTAGIFNPAYNYHNAMDRNYKTAGPKPGLKTILGDRYVPLPSMGVPTPARKGLNLNDQTAMNDQLDRHRELFPAAGLAVITQLAAKGLKVALLCQEPVYDPRQAKTACHRRYIICDLLDATLVELDARKC